MAAPTMRGYLVVTVAEASGRNKEEDDVWDSGFYEGYVKVEVRGPDVPTCKSSSSIKRVLSGQISWQEDIVCEVLEGANELRVMLCKQKRNSKTGAIGQSVVAACGIYVEDILDAVPIDKYFEMFKPKNGGDGGFIRVAMNFSTESPDDAADTDAAPYLPSTEFKSYSKEYNATSAHGRDIEQDSSDDEANQDDPVDDDPIDSDDDDDLIDSTRRIKNTHSVNRSDPADSIDAIDGDHSIGNRRPIDTKPPIESKRPTDSKRQTESKPEDDVYTAEKYVAASETSDERRGGNLLKILIGGAVAVGLVLTQRRQ